MRKKFLFSILIMLVMAAISVGGAYSFTPGNVGAEWLYEKERNDRADEILEQMTLEEKVGQMFIGCFYSSTPAPATVDYYNLGGILLFSPTFEWTSPEVLTEQLNTIDETCTIAPITAVDEEGGLVSRVSSSNLYRSESFKSSRDLYAAGGMNAILAETHERNALLKSIGIDMNFAPVADISTSPSDFMYSRSLGQDAETTATFISESVKACVEDNMACSLKHFPGYGNAVDTHIGSAVDNRTLEQLMANDILPFKAGIEAGAHSILVSHNTVTAIDGTLPASLSPAVHKLLREDLGYEGVVVTDDLIMGAVTEYGTEGEIAVAAVLAGNDLLCTGDYKTQIPAVIAAVNDGAISVDRINESVKRILLLKLQLGLIS